MVASSETHRCALRQRLHAYDAVVIIRRNHVPTVMKRRYVEDEPEVHPQVEVELDPNDPKTRITPQLVQNVLRHDDAPLLVREMQVLKQAHSAKNILHSSRAPGPSAQLARGYVEIQHLLFAWCNRDIVLLHWRWEGARHPPELVRSR